MDKRMFKNTLSQNLYWLLDVRQKYLTKNCIKNHMLKMYKVLHTV